MREILFRGKRTDNGEWVEGGYAIHKETGREFILVVGIDEISPITYMQEVIPETVGEFTGLTDKNGRKIFEGDILRGEVYPYKHGGEYNYFAEVCWWDNSPSFGIYTFKNPSSSVEGISTGDTENMEDWESDEWEVIGNIHDNPELLK